MYKNANIKSKKELAQRLINGEVFYSEGGVKVFFEPDFVEPFRLGDRPLKGAWDDYADMQTKSEWYEDIPVGGVLCWVSDTSADEKLGLSVISEHDKESIYPFLSASEAGWKYATPVKPEECYQEE